MLVSCLLLKKPEKKLYTQQAIDCFNKQTYSSKELVTIETNNMTIGQARNLSISRAKGDILAQWDDDDIYSSDRLTNQIKLMDETNSVACFLKREIVECVCGHSVISFPRDGGKYKYWEHSIVFYPKKLPSQIQYPHQQIGEDTAFVREIMRHDYLKIACLDEPELYTYRFHGDNISGARHFDRIFELSGSNHRPSKCL